MSGEVVTDTYSGKIMLLKTLDSVIDFSKASNQLSIVLYLYNTKRPVSVPELARVIGDTRKSILDSLRKLEKKELISKTMVNGELHIALSQKGEEYVRKLIELLHPVKAGNDDSVLQVPVRLNLAKEVITSLNLYKIIVKIGFSRKGWILVDELKNLVGGEKNLSVILDSFTMPPTRVLRRIKVAGRDAVELDKMGQEILRRSPHYTAFRSNGIYRLLVRLTGTPWVSEITRFLSIASFTILALSILLVVANASLALIAVGFLTVLILLSLSIIVSYIKVE
jgi:DNA-binding MarR family transcriptional regulator